MVVFSMNCKRIRRPNVRLWEVGDLSAAFTCGISKLNDGSPRQRKWKPIFFDHLRESECTKMQLESTNLDSGISLRIPNESQHNTENWDPNSSKIWSEFPFERQSELDFGAVTRRSRGMKRRKRSPNSISSLFCPWKSEPRCKTSEDEKGSEWNQFVGCTSDTGFNICPVNNGCEDSSENGTSGICKEAWDNVIDDQNFSTDMLQRPDDTWTEATWSEEHTTFPQFTNGHNEEVSSDSDVNSVREWLEELGFGKFAHLFEMHEVDKETLPLLTFEDLKDMGIDAVGPRRKLFSAIQQLKRGR